MKEVNDERAIADAFEVVFVPEAFEVAFHHLVREGQGTIHGGDAAAEYAGLKEVAGFPCHRLILADEAGDGAGNRFFACMGHGFPVKLDASAEVKDPLGRGGNKRR